MPKWLWVVSALAVLALGAYGYTFAFDPFSQYQGPGGGGVVCTADAMQCPDGSYVGRTGPNCEFVCPRATSSPETSKTITLKIGESADLLGVYIKPLQVLEDSRCPIDVQCIQAGTVRLKVTLVGGLGLGEYSATLTLGTTLTTEAEKVTLIEVLPAPKSTVHISNDQYQFVFKIEKRTSTQ